MDFQTIQNLNLIWPIIVGISGVIVKNIIPYLHTRIPTYRCNNLQAIVGMMGYELIGVGIAPFLAIFLSIIFGQSSWAIIYFGEYGIALLSSITIYIIGINVMVTLKLERRLKTYIINTVLAVFIYSFFLIPVYMRVINKQNMTNDLSCIIVVLLLFFLQMLVNEKSEKVRNLEYFVVTVDAEYSLSHRPLKYGKYFYLRFFDDNKKEIKRIQIPEDKIVKIECSIDEISTSAENKKQSK